MQVSLHPQEAWLWLLSHSKVSTVCLSGVHSCGKTTLLNILFKQASASKWLSRGPEKMDELARTIMLENSITKEKLESDNAAFLLLQKLIIREMLKYEESRKSRDNICLHDRSVIDPLVYTAWRFGNESEQVFAYIVCVYVCMYVYAKHIRAYAASHL